MPAVRKATAVWAKQLADLLEARGRPADAILREVGLDRAQIADPDARIAFAKHVALIEAAAKHLSDPCFGLHFGASLDILDAGPIGYLAANSPTLGEACTNYATYLALNAEGRRAKLELEAQRARWVVEVTDPMVLSDRQYQECVLASWLHVSRFLVGRRFCPETVEFRHPRETDLEVFRRYFGTTVHFGARRNAITLDRSLLAMPCRSADARLFRIVKAHCDELAAKRRQATDLREEVAHLVAGLLPSGTATTAHVASQLGMSERSLSRRLAERGATFRQILDEERLRMALRYLDDPAVRPTQIAYLLGYAEPSAFYHAFRRWTGKTPVDYRARTVDTPPPAH